MLKIHDFCKNCTYLFPEEIQLLHWVEETAIVYSTVVIWKVSNKIREDHLVVYVSDDKKHNMAFVEKCNEIFRHPYV